MYSLNLLALLAYLFGSLYSIGLFLKLLTSAILLTDAMRLLSFRFIIYFSFDLLLPLEGLLRSK